MIDHDPFAHRHLLEERPPVRGSAFLAWCVILTVVIAVVFWQHQRPPAVVPPRLDRVENRMGDFQARYLVGVKDFARQVGPEFGPQLYEQAAEVLDQGPLRQRLRLVVLAGELVGPEKALERLEELRAAVGEGKVKVDSPESRQLLDLLRRLYSAYEEGRYEELLSGEEKQRLREELGWYGKLALAPPEEPDREERAEVLAPARQTALAVVGGFLGGIALLLIGLVGLVVLLILLFGGTRWRGFATGSPYGAVYAETFAVWLVLFVGLMIAAAFLPPSNSRLLQTSLLLLGSLIALAWPVLRGVPWGQVRQDVGLHAGRGPAREVASSFAGYIVSLPLLVAGMLLVVVLMFLQRQLGGGTPGDEAAPTHPIVGLVTDDWWVRFQILFAASIQAPIVEEIMFRGVFYRHLREATAGWRLAASVLLSGLVSSLIFAVVHPQGLIAVPALMGLALGFALIREWRGSVLPCVVAHGIHNGLITLLLFLLFSG